jgi:hypothetical protein
MRSAFMVVVGLCLASGSGCSSSLARPNWLNPGPVGYQQQVAERFDPYPEDDLGPPIVGGRPREYEIPRPPTPLKPSPAPTSWGAAGPVQLAPTPGAYSPGVAPSAVAPPPVYPQTPYPATGAPSPGPQ